MSGVGVLSRNRQSVSLRRTHSDPARLDHHKPPYQSFALSIHQFSYGFAKP